MEKHIVAVTAIVFQPNTDKFLIVKRRDTEIAYPGYWAFPGGKVEKGETIQQTIAREVEEEAGLHVQTEPVFVGDYTFVRPDSHNVIGVCFMVRATDTNVTISDDFDDHAWVTLNELKNFKHIEGMEAQAKKALTHVHQA